MRLLKLSSNNSKFKTLDFHSGLNIISGLQLSKKENKTINGIGKSLSLKLIHHILGATFRSQEEKKFESFLKTYGIFQLDFIHNDNEYSIKKKFSETDFFIDNRKIVKTRYPEELRKILLGNESTLSFRQLFNVFARRFGGTYYTDALTQQGMPKEAYSQKYVNLYLLDIDTRLIEKKASIKKEISKANEFEKKVKEYEEKINQSNLKDLREEIAKYKKRKTQFVIAENYNELKTEADNLTIQLNEIRNKIYEAEKLKALKKANLEHSNNINVNIKQIEKIYYEARFFFKDKIKKRLKDAQDFHNKLVILRKASLFKEIKVLESGFKNFKNLQEQVGKKRDKQLEELSKKGAFNEYELLCNQIKDLENEVKDIEQYKNILNELNEKKTNLNLENAELKKESLNYLKSIKWKTNGVEEKFRQLVKKFYGDTGGSFDIKETADAQYLFDIELNIPKDGSQGVGGVKIFCYDILLYQLNKGLLDFVAHDACIFSEMDPRQKSMIFKVILEIIEKNDFQYFVNISESSLNEVLEKNKEIGILTKEQKEKIENSQILKLYDRNPKNWLFGEEFS